VKNAHNSRKGKINIYDYQAIQNIKKEPEHFLKDNLNPTYLITIKNIIQSYYQDILEIENEITQGINQDKMYSYDDIYYLLHNYINDYSSINQAELILNNHYLINQEGYNKFLFTTSDEMLKYYTSKEIFVPYTKITKKNKSSYYQFHKSPHFYMRKDILSKYTYNEISISSDINSKIKLSKIIFNKSGLPVAEVSFSYSMDHFDQLLLDFNNNDNDDNKTLLNANFFIYDSQTLNWYRILSENKTLTIYPLSQSISTWISKYFSFDAEVQANVKRSIEKKENFSYYHFYSPLKMYEDNKRSYAEQGYLYTINYNQFSFNDINYSLIFFTTYFSKNLLESQETIFFIIFFIFIIAFILFIIIAWMASQSKKHFNLLHKWFVESSFDNLTQVYKRDSIINIVKELEDNKYNYGIALMDIDHFKSVNDTYGHDQGDMVLHNVASLLRKNVRTNDFVGRWGGEEFVIILTNTSASQVEAKANQLRELVKQKTKNPQITISMGVTFKTYTHVEKYSYQNFNNMIMFVDKLLYQSKKNGRNLVTYEDLK